MIEPTSPPSPQPAADVFSRSAAVYDRVYAPRRDYATAAEQLRSIIEQHRRTAAKGLLDVACGTGSFFQHLSRYYDVEGIDLSTAMLDMARQRYPGVPLHRANLVDFNLGRRFAVVTCLGSSIGYAKTVPRLRRALQTLSLHTLSGGVIVVEPWFWPDVFRPNALQADFVDEPDFKLARVEVGRIEHNVSVLDFHYLVATASGVDHFTEQHELGLFTNDDYLAAFQAADLEVSHDPDGLCGLGGRGLYIGVRR